MLRPLESSLARRDGAVGPRVPGEVPDPVERDTGRGSEHYIQEARRQRRG